MSRRILHCDPEWEDQPISLQIASLTEQQRQNLLEEIHTTEYLQNGNSSNTSSESIDSYLERRRLRYSVSQRNQNRQRQQAALRSANAHYRRILAARRQNANRRDSIETDYSHTSQQSTTYIRHAVATVSRNRPNVHNAFALMYLNICGNHCATCHQNRVYHNLATASTAVAYRIDQRPPGRCEYCRKICCFGPNTY